MTDPGGGYGWRSARHLPRRRGGVLSWGQVARHAEEFGEERPLCLLLLPAPLEQFELRERAEDLLTAPGVAAVDPPRMGYGRFAETFAVLQAKRMRLPGFPRMLVLFDPLQYPLARALISVHPDAELWYGPGAPPDTERGQQLDELAAARADRRFERPSGPAHQVNLPLWERMEALGIESGRLGSERADVRGSS